jgi:hypothetical protein
MLPPLATEYWNALGDAWIVTRPGESLKVMNYKKMIRI